MLQILRSVIWILVTAVALSNGPARADMYGFASITNTSAANAAAGEAQLSVDVSDVGGGQVLFTFLNVGLVASSITDVYFDDSNDDSNPLASLASITNGTGVSFSNGANPSSLPAGNSITPSFTANFDLDSNAPAQPNGVNPGETLGLTFNLASGVAFGDLIDELEAATLRIGIHVQGFANGGSESFVNKTSNPVPAPGAWFLGATGLALVERLRRRWSRNGQARA